jgi:hypothetical protein
MKHGLPASTVAQVHGVLTRHPEVERAILYGSRAKGNFKPGSDIDLTLSGSGLDERIRGRIDEELEAVMDSLPEDTQAIGFYSYGEVCPGDFGDFSELHNQTMTITVLGERA